MKDELDKDELDEEEEVDLPPGMHLVGEGGDDDVEEKEAAGDDTDDLDDEVIVPIADAELPEDKPKSRLEELEEAEKELQEEKDDLIIGFDDEDGDEGY